MVWKVFISSTNEDLREYREEAREAALKCGFMPVMFEHWPAFGNRRPIEACLKAVSDSDLLVAVVAHRYGWIPGGPSGGTHHSICWMECEEASGRAHKVQIRSKRIRR